MTYSMKVSGKNMPQAVILEIEAVTNVQAIFKARDKANTLNLDWEEIELI